MTDLRSITVETTVGDVNVAFGPNHHVAAVLAESVVWAYGAPPGNFFEYDLVSASGDEIEPGATLGGSGIEDGDTLRLEPNPTAI